MKTNLIAALLIVGIVWVLPMRAASDAAINVEITASDQMKFNVTRIDARAGQTVRIQLTNNGNLPKEVMGHNWVLLKAGIDANAYASAAMSAGKENYEPKSLADQVLASVPLLGPKRQGEVTFNAPTTPGTYQYLCSFPGHCLAGMRGQLVVK